jgi:mycofactocin precursor
MIARGPDGNIGPMERTTETVPASDDAGAADADLIDDELLVEEISIDGMCGVY